MNLDENNRIAIGTAQFGMDYGINNKKGRIPRSEVYEILDEAEKSGINTIDTAPAYGDSESIIGIYQKNRGNKFNVISKLSSRTKEEARVEFTGSLNKLGQNNIYGYLIHDFNNYLDNPEIWDVLKEYRSKGKVKKIGFSLYHPEDLKIIIDNNIDFDMVQVPYSVFDRRFEKYFGLLINKKIEIQTRSVFLQGLVFKGAAELSGDFSGFRAKIENINMISANTKIPLVSLCLGFVFANDLIDKVVVGIDSLSNYKDIIESASDISRVKAIYDDLSVLKEENEDIIIPSNWGKVRRGVKI